MSDHQTALSLDGPRTRTTCVTRCADVDNDQDTHRPDHSTRDVLSVSKKTNLKLDGIFSRSVSRFIIRKYLIQYYVGFLGTDRVLHSPHLRIIVLTDFSQLPLFQVYPSQHSKSPVRLFASVHKPCPMMYSGTLFFPPQISLFLLLFNCAILCIYMSN